MWRCNYMDNSAVYACYEKIQEFLGQGSFGFVTVVRKKQGVMHGSFFALKSLSKRGVVEGGQVQHIKDEKTVSDSLGDGRFASLR